MSDSSRTSALRRYLPDPTRLWICGSPLSWPGAPGLWCHLAERRLGANRSTPLPAIDPGAADDVVYVPPVDEGLRAEVDDLVRWLRAEAVPVVAQRAPGEDGGGEVDYLDLLEPLVTGGSARLREIETTLTQAVWPLIPGLTDDPDGWRDGLEALAAAGVRRVVPLILDLEAADCRRLAEYTDEAGYQALFHGGRPDDRAFAREAARHGLDVFPERPELEGNARSRFARRAAAELAQAAELWLRLGRAETAGQNLLRASRWTDRSVHDLKALAREGNLGVIPWLDAESRAVVGDLAAGDTSRLRRELEEEYLA